MNKRVICIYVVVTFIIIGIISIIMLCNKPKNHTGEIITYEIQTPEYFDNADTMGSKYFINSKEELDAFYKLYSNRANIDANYLKDNYIFIETVQVGSGSISFKIKEVNFNNKTLNYVIDSTYPEVGTDDMAFWYLVAVIPKSELKGIDISNWQKPSTVINNQI